MSDMWGAPDQAAEPVAVRALRASDLTGVPDQAAEPMAVGMRTSTEGGSDVAEFYRPTQETLELDDEGIELSSAPVTAPLGGSSGADVRRGKGLVRRADTDDAGDATVGPGARALQVVGFP